MEANTEKLLVFLACEDAKRHVCSPKYKLTKKVISKMTGIDGNWLSVNIQRLAIKDKLVYAWLQTLDSDDNPHFVLTFSASKLGFATVEEIYHKQGHFKAIVKALSTPVEAYSPQSGEWYAKLADRLKGDMSGVKSLNHLFEIVNEGLGS